MTRINLTVDGAKVADDVEPRMLLVQYLRERLGKTGTVVGCESQDINGGDGFRATGADVTLVSPVAINEISGRNGLAACRRCTKSPGSDRGYPPGTR